MTPSSIVSSRPGRCRDHSILNRAVHPNAYCSKRPHVCCHCVSSLLLWVCISSPSYLKRSWSALDCSLICLIDRLPMGPIRNVMFVVILCGVMNQEESLVLCRLMVQGRSVWFFDILHVLILIQFGTAQHYVSTPP